MAAKKRISIAGYFVTFKHADTTVIITLFIFHNRIWTKKPRQYA